MGFDVDAAQIALEATGGNIESARAWAMHQLACNWRCAVALVWCFAVRVAC